MSSKLSFFKFVYSCEEMSIPPGSVARMQEFVDDGVILKDVYNNSWSLEMERDGGSLYFKKGWRQFYQENRLKSKDVLVFQHQRRNLFEFKLCGRNTCKKIGVGGSRVSVKEEEEEEMDLDENDQEYSADEDEDDVVNEEETEEDDPSLCGRDFTLNPKSPNQNVKEEEESAENNGYDEAGTEIKKEEEEVTLISKAEFTSRKKNIPECYGIDIFESGLAIRPKNPYFVSRSRKARVNHLHIPDQVMDDFELDIKENERLVVVDGSGRKWKVKVSKWKDGRMWCNRVWGSMCKENGIGVDDACICEFVQDKEALYMLVKPLSL